MAVISGNYRDKMKNSALKSGFFTRQPIRLGYIRLSDCAPLVVAEEFGIFKNFDLDVRLSREVGWASVRDKLVYGELDASQALGPMPFAVCLGLGSMAEIAGRGQMKSILTGSEWGSTGEDSVNSSESEDSTFTLLSFIGKWKL